MAGKVQSGVPQPMLNWDNHDQAYAYNEWYSFLNSYFCYEQCKRRRKVALHSVIQWDQGSQGYELMGPGRDDKEGFSKFTKQQKKAKIHPWPC